MIMVMIIMIITRLSRHDEAQDLVDDLFNDDQEEIVHVPTPVTQEEIVQVPIPMTQEEIVQVPTNIQQEIVQVPTNIQQEIVHEPMIIHRVGPILPLSPKERNFYFTVYQRTLPSSRYAFFL